MRKTIGKIAFWCPCWLFLSLLALLFLVALSACGGDTKPLPTFTPAQQEWRKCLVQETRLDRSNENLDRAAIYCKSRLQSLEQP